MTTWKIIMSTLVVGVSTLHATEMKRLPGGEFRMGGVQGVKDANPAHEVVLRPFYIDVHEVTQKEYQRLTGQNPAKFRDPARPVERVRWTDAILFCNLRSKEAGLKECYNLDTMACDFSANGFRLPSEAEWEYACRGGKDSGDENKPRYLGRYAWFRSNSQEKTHPVGQKRANSFGLFDMLGNVAEWCHDYYAADFYATSPRDNPRGPKTGRKRVLRGGSWADRPRKVSPRLRVADDPATSDICQGYDTYGFRCVRNAPGKGGK